MKGVSVEIVDVVLEPPIPPLPEELPQPRPQSLVKILGSGALSGVVSWGVVELISGGQLPPAAGGTVATVAAVASSSAFMYGWRNRNRQRSAAIDRAVAQLGSNS